MAKNQPSNQPPAELAARIAALHMLTQVLNKRQALEQSASKADLNALSASDRAFAQLLVKTVLRRLGQLDALIDAFLDKPLPPGSTSITHCLRLGLAQLLFLRTPPHAAIHTSVELVKHANAEGLSGLVNAVLRRASREGDAMLAAQAITLNAPAWLYKAWCNAYGESTAKAIIHAHLQEAPLDLSFKNPESCATFASRCGATILTPASLRLKDAGAVTALAGFEEGDWWVQDAAASLPALLLGDIKGKTVLDMCAAPGGKTAQLISAGADVTALDRSPPRMQTLSENLHRLKLEATLVTADALTYKPAHAFDAILLDAPCSATGTLRRHPDVAYHRNQEDIARLANTQRALLNHSLTLLKPGGTLVYAVCSLQPEEGEAKIRQCLAENKTALLKPITKAEMPEPFHTAITPEGWLRTLPCHLTDIGGMDGFFAARLMKQAVSL